jgi:hypothetical protein
VFGARRAVTAESRSRRCSAARDESSAGFMTGSFGDLAHPAGHRSRGF